MAPVEDTRTRVIRLIEADPHLTAEEIGNALGVTRQRVHKILRDAGYEREWKKQPDQAAKPKRGKRDA